MLGYILGCLTGMSFMCVLQINRTNKINSKLKKIMKLISSHCEECLNKNRFCDEECPLFKVECQIVDIIKR